jgi:archaellum component FlaF (FlaF/FlaG flagellin family)
MTIAGQAFTVTQTGTSGPPKISVSPTLLYFGYVKTSGTSSKTVTVTNTGTGPLAITSLQITGSQGTSFSAASSGTTVAPGASCTITVTFAPKLRSSQMAHLMIYSNDPARKAVSVQLYGYGN